MEPLTIQGKFVQPGDCHHCGGMHYGESYRSKSEAITELHRIIRLCRDARIMLRMPDAKPAQSEA